ncbi:MAG: hypothetical protein J6V44_12415 [Methanobrevibacter sp.]|jgi:hypothetical protein|nr:hypothetical protein [Methanobrevibacter sp.]
MLYEALFGKDTVKKLKQQSAAIQWSYSVLHGSTLDGSVFRVLNSMFGEKPPVLSAVEKLINSSTKMVMGDADVVDFLTTNIGAIREFNNILKN